jgi:thymidylate kinase
MLEAEYLALRPPDIQFFSVSVLKNHDSLARYLYYLSGAASLLEAAQQSDLVVVDRFIASAHALHIHVPGEVAESLRQLDLPGADLTVYLHVSETVRRMRLAKRGRALDPFEARLNEDEGFRLKVAGRLQAGPGTHLIDTTDLRPRAVAAQARDIWLAASQQEHSGHGGAEWLR